MILYLHGFRSSPRSFKATLLAGAVRARGLGDEWRCPQLPASPSHALALTNGLIEHAFPPGTAQTEHRLVLIGSSLGGYYATCLAQRWNCRAILLNPVIHAARDLATQVGEHLPFHGGNAFTFRPEYVDELAAMAVAPPAHPARYFLLAATGDEVLDWREMAEWFRGCRQHIIDGGDHGLSDFANYLPEVLEFATAPA